MGLYETIANHYRSTINDDDGGGNDELDDDGDDGDDDVDDDIDVALKPQGKSIGFNATRGELREEHDSLLQIQFWVSNLSKVARQQPVVYTGICDSSVARSITCRNTTSSHIQCCLVFISGKHLAYLDQTL